MAPSNDEPVRGVNEKSVIKLLNATKWLGYSINFLANDAPSVFSIDVLEQGNYFSSHRTIKMSTETQDVDVGAPVPTTFQAPVNLRVTTDSRTSVGDLITRANGDEVIQTMNANAEIGAKYMGLTVAGSVGVAKGSQYKTDKQYAFKSKNISSYVATFESINQKDFMDPDLIQEAIALPAWDLENANTVAAYRAFFRTYGSHMINVAGYGWRYQLECNQSNADSEENDSFELNMKVKYEGFDAGAGYKQSQKYLKFNRESQVVVKAIGGALNLANAVMEDPANLTKKATWEDEAGTKADEGLTNLRMVPIAKVFDGLSPASTYRPVTIKMAEGLFDLQKACTRTLVVNMNWLSKGGSVEITSKNGSFVLGPGESNNKVRQLLYGSWGPGWYPTYGGRFQIQSGTEDTLTVVVNFTMINPDDSPRASGGSSAIVYWSPEGGPKSYELETVTWPSVVLPVSKELYHEKATFVLHPQPALGGAFWWRDDQPFIRKEAEGENLLNGAEIGRSPSGNMNL